MSKFLKVYIFFLLTFLFYKLIFKPMGNLTNPDYNSARSLILSDYLKNEKMKNHKQEIFKVDNFDCLSYFFTKNKKINRIENKKIVESEIPKVYQKILFIVSKEDTHLKTIVLNEPLMMKENIDLKEILASEDKLLEKINCPVIKDKNLIINAFNKK